MSSRDGLRGSVGGCSSEAKTRRKTAYQRHFEGYVLYALTHKDGKIRRVYVYTGMIRHVDMPDSKHRLLRAKQAVLWIISTALFVLSAIEPLMNNATWYMALLQAADIATLFWMFSGFVGLLLAGRNMTEDAYHSGPARLLDASGYAAWALVVTALCMMVGFVTQPDDPPALLLRGALLCAASAGATIVVHMMEKQVTYLKCPSQAQPPVNYVKVGEMT